MYVHVRLVRVRGREGARTRRESVERRGESTAGHHRHCGSCCQCPCCTCCLQRLSQPEASPVSQAGARTAERVAATARGDGEADVTRGMPASSLTAETCSWRGGSDGVAGRRRAG